MLHSKRLKALSRPCGGCTDGVSEMQSRGLQREFFSAEDIAEYLGIAPYTVRELCRTGKLQHVKLGRMIRIRKDWADTFADSQTRAALGD